MPPSNQAGYLAPAESFELDNLIDEFKKNNIALRLAIELDDQNQIEECDKLVQDAQNLLLEYDFRTEAERRKLYLFLLRSYVLTEELNSFIPTTVRERLLTILD